MNRLDKGLLGNEGTIFPEGEGVSREMQHLVCNILREKVIDKASGMWF